MRIAEYKQIDVEYINKTIHHESTTDENGEIIPAYDEIIQEEKPVFGMVYRDATAEEIAEMQAAQNDEAENLPTAEERLNDIENALLELAEIISEG